MVIVLDSWAVERFIILPFRCFARAFDLIADNRSAQSI